ncbi:MAG: hypothetical protein Q8R28_11225 [Dehalococcoidia bacterium]|nr:hypothetical protein [Dehalococcoidia bacterium]
MKRIPYRDSYLPANGRKPFQTEVRNDDDDEVVWATPPDKTAAPGTPEAAGTPKLRVANTYDLLRDLLVPLGWPGFALMHRTDDERRIMGLLNAVEDAEEGRRATSSTEGVVAGPGIGDVVLGDKLYLWFRGLLSRDVPMDTDAVKNAEKVKALKAESGEARSYAWALWNRSAALMRFTYLIDPDDKEYVGRFNPEE